MNLFYIKHNEREHHFAVTDVLVEGGIAIVFIKNQLPGEWVYLSESDTIKRVDIESIDEYKVLTKQICDNYSEELLLDKLKLILKSQTIVKNDKEVWTKIKYDVTDSEGGGKMVNVISHKVAFYFGESGELKGMRSWK